MDEDIFMNLLFFFFLQFSGSAFLYAQLVKSILHLWRQGKNPRAASQMSE